MELFLKWFGIISKVIWNYSQSSLELFPHSFGIIPPGFSFPHSFGIVPPGLWNYSQSYLELFPELLGIIPTCSWNYSKSYLEFFPPTSGRFPTWFWNFPHPILDFFPIGSGLFPTQIWNFSHSNLEFSPLDSGLFPTFFFPFPRGQSHVFQRVRGREIRSGLMGTTTGMQTPHGEQELRIFRNLWVWLGVTLVLPGWPQGDKFQPPTWIWWESKRPRAEVSTKRH